MPYNLRSVKGKPVAERTEVSGGGGSQEIELTEIQRLKNKLIQANFVANRQRRQLEELQNEFRELEQDRYNARITLQYEQGEKGKIQEELSTERRRRRSLQKTLNEISHCYDHGNEAQDDDVIILGEFDPSPQRGHQAGTPSQQHANEAAQSRSRTLSTKHRGNGNVQQQHGRRFVGGRKRGGPAIIPRRNSIRSAKVIPRSLKRVSFVEPSDEGASNNRV